MNNWEGRAPARPKDLERKFAAQARKGRVGARPSLWMFAAFMIGGWAVRADADDPWADSVLDYTSIMPVSGFTDPAKALGAPVGGKISQPDNSSVVSLGVPRASITLKFDTPVTDDANNPFGLDFIVYANAFWVAGNPQRKFQEPAVVEISEDINANGVADDPWYFIPGSRGLSLTGGLTPIVSEPDGLDNSSNPLHLGGNILNPNGTDEEFNWGYAEMTPTVQPYLDNYVRPDNPFEVGLTPGSGGGDAFDIAWAVDTLGMPANLTQFHFVRITTLVDRFMFGLGPLTSEVDAVADVAPKIDTDGDGILDAFESDVAGTDPSRRESTVLALEIPAVFGGSPNGTELGTAEDADGNAITLVSSGERTGATRAFNMTTDITSPADPGGALPGGRLKSAAFRQFVASESDFVAAEIQPARFTIYYHPLDIAGLDENGLDVFRFTGSGWTQDELVLLTLDKTTNLVTFTSRFPGTFVLGSVAGSGDPDVVLPQGTIALNASPSNEIVVGLAQQLEVTSSTIFTYEGNPVSDGELFTVSLEKGTVDGVDASPGDPGFQVASSGGSLAFTVNTSTVAGSADMVVASVAGSAIGQLDYTFLPGPPSDPVTFFVIGRTEIGPTVSLQLRSELIRDAFGNVVSDGTQITLDLSTGTVTTPDADGVAPNHQLVVLNGIAAFGVDITTETTSLGITTFLDSGLTQPVDTQLLLAEDFFPLPVKTSAAVCAALLMTGLGTFVLRRTRGRRQ